MPVLKVSQTGTGSVILGFVSDQHYLEIYNNFTSVDTVTVEKDCGRGN